MVRELIHNARSSTNRGSSPYPEKIKMNIGSWKKTASGLIRRNPRSFVISLVILFGLVLLLFPNGKWQNARFDSILDEADAVIIFTTFLLLLLGETLQKKTKPGTSGIASAFATVSILRLLAGTTEDMNRVTWLHRLSSVALGFAFLIGWLPVTRNSATRVRARAFGLALVLALALVFGFIAFAFPERLPRIIVEREFTLVSVLFGVGAALFFFAAGTLKMRAFSPGDLESIPILVCCLVFGLAALIQPFTSLWDTRWWMLQFLELIPPVTISFLFFVNHNRHLLKTREELKEALGELKRSNDELENYSSVTAHDLAEPLRMSLKIACQLLSRDCNAKLNEQEREYLEYAIDGAKRMSSLVKALLEYSRIGRGERSRENVDVRETMNQVLANLAVLVKEHGADVRIGKLPSVLYGDPTSQLVQVFQNLVSNAIKYHKSDAPPRVDIEAVPKGDHWIFSIRDNGNVRDQTRTHRSDFCHVSQTSPTRRIPRNRHRARYL